VAVGGLAAYGTSLYLKIDKDTKEYKAVPNVVPAEQLPKYQALAKTINSNQATLNIVAGAAGVLAAANIVYMIVRKKPAGRTSLLIRSGNQLTSIGLIRRF